MITISHFKNGETEALRAGLTCPESYSFQVEKLGRETQAA